MKIRCLTCIPNGDCVKCEDPPIPEKFDVNFCPICPRRSSCHYRGCIIDERNLKRLRDEKSSMDILTQHLYRASDKE